MRGVQQVVLPAIVRLSVNFPELCLGENGRGGGSPPIWPLPSSPNWTVSKVLGLERDAKDASSFWRWNDSKVPSAVESTLEEIDFYLGQTHEEAKRRDGIRVSYCLSTHPASLFLFSFSHFDYLFLHLLPSTSSLHPPLSICPPSALEGGGRCCEWSGLNLCLLIP